MLPKYLICIETHGHSHFLLISLFHDKSCVQNSCLYLLWGTVYVGNIFLLSLSKLIFHCSTVQLFVFQKMAVKLWAGVLKDSVAPSMVSHDLIQLQLQLWERWFFNYSNDHVCQFHLIIDCHDFSFLIRVCILFFSHLRLILSSSNAAFLNKWLINQSTQCCSEPVA